MMEHFRGKEEYHVPPRMHGQHSHSRRYTNNNNINSYHEDDSNNPSMSSSLEEDWSWNEPKQQQQLFAGPAAYHQQQQQQQQQYGQPSPVSKSVTASPSHHSLNNPCDMHDLTSTSTSNQDVSAGAFGASPNLRGQTQRGMNPRESEYPWHTPPRLQRMRRQQKREKKQRNHGHSNNQSKKQPRHAFLSVASPFPYGQAQTMQMSPSLAQSPWTAYAAMANMANMAAMNMNMSMQQQQPYTATTATMSDNIVPPSAIMYGGGGAAAYPLPPSPLFICDAYGMLPPTAATAATVTPPQEPESHEALLPIALLMMESMTLNNPHQHELQPPQEYPTPEETHLKSSAEQHDVHTSSSNEFDREMDDIDDIITLSIDELFGETAADDKK